MVRTRSIVSSRLVLYAQSFLIFLCGGTPLHTTNRESHGHSLEVSYNASLMRSVYPAFGVGREISGGHKRPAFRGRMKHFLPWPLGVYPRGGIHAVIMVEGPIFLMFHKPIVFRTSIRDTSCSRAKNAGLEETRKFVRSCERRLPAVKTMVAC